MQGAGKYDNLCTAVRKAAEARGVILIVIGGTRGSGFSCQATFDISRELPGILREMADQIEADNREMKG